MDVWPSEERAAASGTVSPSFSTVGRSIDSRFCILVGLASLAAGHSALLPRTTIMRLLAVPDDVQRRSQTRQLEPKRAIGNMPRPVGAISGAMAYNSDDGICRPYVVDTSVGRDASGCSAGVPTKNLEQLGQTPRSSGRRDWTWKAPQGE